MDAERGAALITSLLAIVILSAVGSALVLTTTTDLAIAANAGASTDAFYAAEGALERTLSELREVADLTGVLDGSVASRFTDGPAAGARRLPDGSILDLSIVLNRARCAKSAACSSAELDAVRPNRPWGARNPRWRLFSYGPFDGVSALGPRGAPLYTVSMVADDPADNDGDSQVDGRQVGSSANPGAGVVLVRAEAFGRRGANRVLESTVLRLDRQALAAWQSLDPLTRGAEPVELPRLQVLSWREVR